MTAQQQWFLEGRLRSDGEVVWIPLDHFPFRIGRQRSLSLALKAKGISRLHAEINWDGSQLWLMDLDSTNGTFVNRQRAEERSPLAHGDQVQFADLAFTVVDGAERAAETTAGDSDAEIEVEPLQQMLEGQQISVLFQPLIDRAEHTLFAFEALARGDRTDLPSSPVALFELARDQGLELELAHLMRRVAVRAAAASGQQVPIFLNIHPEEVQRPGQLLEDIANLRTAFAQVQMVLEIHEAAVANRDHLQDVGSRLKTLGVQLAYDDFGSGQARLTALAEVPPDYVKLSASLMRDIDTSPPAHQQTVRMLVSYAQGMDIKVVAEGISSDAEARFCDDLKIDLLQGVRYGEPEALGHG